MKPTTRVEEISELSQVLEWLRWLYKTVPVSSGVVHPTAVWRSPEGSLVTLKIEEGAPESAVDFFLLNAVRARADAIVTTGQILRDEGELSHGLQGPGQVPQALAAWRKVGLGKPGLPTSLVLTSGRDVDLDHPLFTGGDTRPLVFTGEEGRQRLESEASRRGVEVAAHPSPGIREALAFLRRRGAETISIEAGPSTSRGLYEDPLAVDEVCLSVYEASDLASSKRGGEFLPEDELRNLFSQKSAGRRVKETSGPWRFTRFLRDVTE